MPRASGRTLEIGVGTGLNLGLYDRERVTQLLAIDPSPSILAKARERIAECHVPVELQEASAEALPFDAGSFESVVMTYSLCSVDEPLRALREIRRVLRSDGRLLFVEHGLARARSTRAWQRGLTPLWKRVSGNCHLDRDVPAELREAGLRVEELDESTGDGWSVSGYTYEGIAVPT
ncbi:MAG TPA: class I SAM-dependent methyltransferase [Labilithrix sp.]|nr:class I SAM-dependent methyltransferase [Labilithrix sp.]